jgi:hypothetical protein
VTEWRWYDSVATERYLGHPPRHPDARSSLFPLAAGLTRPLSLVHGLADDNVHLRHSLLLARARLTAARDHEVLLLPGVTLGRRDVGTSGALHRSLPAGAKAGGRPARHISNEAGARNHGLRIAI